MKSSAPLRYSLPASLMGGILVFTCIGMPLVCANDGPYPYKPKCGDCEKCSEESNGSGSDPDSDYSMSASWRLGVVHPLAGASYQKFAPKLSYWIQEVTPAAFDRQTLQLEEPQNAEVIRNNGNRIRQIRTNTGMTDIKDLASPAVGFEIRFFAASDVPAVKSGGFYVIPATAEPLKTVTLWNPTSTSTPDTVYLKVRSIYSGTVSNRFYSFERTAGTVGAAQSHEFTYHYGSDASAPEWKKVISQHTPVSNGAPGEYTLFRTESLRGTDNQFHVVDQSWKRIALYKDEAPAVLEDRAGATNSSGDGWLNKVTRSFYTNPADPWSFNKPASMTRVRRENASAASSPAYTETYSYTENTTSGWRQTVTTKPWLDIPGGRVITTREETNAAAASFTKDQIGSQIVSYSSTSRTERANGFEIEEQTTETHSGGNKVTTTTRHANVEKVVAHLRGRAIRILHPDGTLETFAYELVSGKLVITHDQGAASGAAVASGKRTVTRHNLETTLDEKIEDYALESGQAYLLSTREAITFDTAGRPERWAYDNDPADYSEVLRDCCEISDERSRDGTSRSYTHDPLGRQTSVTDSVTGVTTHTLINGLVTIITRTPNGGVPVEISRSTRNLAGETVSVVTPALVEDENNPDIHIATTATTGHVYDHANLTVTTTRPDTSTETRTSYLDGRTKSTGGTAAVPMLHTYETHAEYGGGLKSTVSLAADIQNPVELESTWTDRLGNVFKVSVPDDASDADSDPQVTHYAYNPASQRISATEPDGIVTRYAYNTRGEMESTILDMTRSGGDTALRTSTTLTVFDPSWPEDIGAWRSTRSLNGVLLATSWRTHDGMQSRQSRPGVANDTITDAGTHLGHTDGAWTVTTTLPDNNRTIETHTGHRLTRSEHQRADAYVNYTTEYTYDPDWKYLASTSARGGVTTTDIDPATGLVKSVTAPGNRVTKTFHDLMGRVVHTSLPLAKHQYATYTLRGEVENQWGDLGYPTRREYSLQGRLEKLHTYKDHTGAATAFPTVAGELTEWAYYPVTGLLASKSYPLDPGLTYTYTSGGRIKTRSGGRGITTTYTYDFEQSGEPLAPEIHSITYSDGSTPGVSYQHLADGRLFSIDNGISATTYGYDATTLQLTTETVTLDPDGPGGQPALTRVIKRTPDTLGRPFGLELLDNGTPEHDISYLYGSTGRLRDLNSINFPKAAGQNYSFRYTYHANAENTLWQTFSPVAVSINTPDWQLETLNTKENKAGTTSISRYDYTVNSIGQRDDLTTSGSAFSAGSSNGLIDWDYNDRGEVTTADHPLAAADRAYAFDFIGNRLTARAGDGALANGGTLTSYLSNADNQYAGTGAISGGLNADPVFDDDGNMTVGPLSGTGGSSANRLKWDAENRLVEIRAADDSTVIASYAYDAQSRRVAKSAGATTTLTLYDGWNPLADYTIQNSSFTIQNSYAWGIDLSGSMQGAGGVGGLLGVKIHSGDHAGTYHPTFDGNGNVSEYLTSTGAIAAHYEYDPFGNDITPAAGVGGKHDVFEIRFSTKKRDPESGLYYYGYRYYDPITGRWPSRDPIGERGGVNLYGFVGNDGVNEWDFLGLENPPCKCKEDKGSFKEISFEFTVITMVTSYTIEDPGGQIMKMIKDKAESGSGKGGSALDEAKEIAKSVTTGASKFAKLFTAVHEGQTALMVEEALMNVSFKICVEADGDFKWTDDGVLGMSQIGASALKNPGEVRDGMAESLVDAATQMADKITKAKK